MRQGASGRDTKRPNSGAPHQNPGADPDPVLEALAGAMTSWSESRDPVDLRRQLAAVVSILEAIEVA